MNLDLSYVSVCRLRLIIGSAAAIIIAGKSKTVLFVVLLAKPTYCATFGKPFRYFIIATSLTFSPNFSLLRKYFVATSPCPSLMDSLLTLPKLPCPSVESVNRPLMESFSTLWLRGYKFGRGGFSGACTCAASASAAAIYTGHRLCTAFLWAQQKMVKN